MTSVFHGGSSFFIEGYKDIDILVNGGRNRTSVVAAILAHLPEARLESEDYYDTAIQSIRLGQYNIIVLDENAYDGAHRSNEVLKLLSDYPPATAPQLIADKRFRVALNRIVRDGMEADTARNAPY